MNLLVILSIISAMIMLYALWSVILLKKSAPGGVIGRNMKGLVTLVVLFAVGYILVPFLGDLSKENLTLTMNIIFLFGAIYVVTTISLIKRIIQALVD